MPRRLLAAVALVLLAAVAAIAWAVTPGPPASEAGGVAIGGPFTLTDQDGKTVSDTDYRGRYMLVYFGYTFCPDVCPLGLQTIAQALDALPPAQAAKVVPLFITVDPARDTPAVLRDYVQSFHPRLVGLTGDEAAIRQVIGEYRVYAQRAADAPADGGYLVDHSTFTYLMGPDGRYVAHFGHDATAQAMAKRLDAILAATS